MPIYELYWEDPDTEEKINFFIEIEANLETVEKLLEEYKETTEDYYDMDKLLEFLKKNGIKAKLWDADYSIEF